MNKLYSVHDHWTDINKKNDVDIESIDGVITGIKVNGEDYSGTSWTKVFSGDVVTSGEAVPFSGTINAVLSGADTIKVFYNNGVYILPKQVTDDGIFYGAHAPENPSNIDFSEIPFLIKLGEVNTALYTQSAGPQDITILEPQSGGGESDFSTAEVTIATTRRLGAQYSLNCQAETDNSFVSAIINPIGSLNTSADDKVVTVNNPDIHNILFTKNGHIDIFTPTYDNITVEGNGEVITDGEAKFARAYGECTITIN